MKAKTMLLSASLDLDEAKSYLSNTELVSIYKTKNTGLIKQKIYSYYTAKKLLGKKTKNSSISYSKTGRPIFTNEKYDLSISHKHDRVYVGIVDEDYRIGVDIEHCNAKLNESRFIKYFLTDEECIAIENFCAKNEISVSRALVIFLSIKESFFKCVDCDFKPKSLSIVNILKQGSVKIKCSKNLKNIMEKRKLKIHYIKVKYDKKYVHSITIMKKK
ncbi:hypothetical protein CMO93_03185 [Candidatus Woesearchaeota archaeon]|nr:hypothetical protein [Candidatus Woesearchaeota archaeon]|tara:strand:+ start:2188 stop:2838 length:651 start_codon:yes stop_codon:yes gene_type:complete